MQIIFLSGTKFLCLAQHVNKFMVQHKKFRPAQNILGLVKGQGTRFINIYDNNDFLTFRNSNPEILDKKFLLPLVGL